VGIWTISAQKTSAKIRRAKMIKTIIIEIPHQFPPNAWTDDPEAIAAFE